MFWFQIGRSSKKKKEKKMQFRIPIRFKEMPKDQLIVSWYLVESVNLLGFWYWCVFKKIYSKICSRSEKFFSSWIFANFFEFQFKMCSHEGHAGGLFGDESLKGESLSLFK